MTAALFLAVSILFGGGGSPSPISELIVQLAAIAALAATLAAGWAYAGRGTRYSSPHLGSRTSPLRRDPLLTLAAAALVALPLAQLLPVPPAWWHAAPGREQVVAALTLVGAQNDWRPLSIAPPRTVAALLSLIPPVTMLFLTARLPRREQLLLLGVVAAGGVVSAALAAMQLTGGDAFHLYAQSNPDQLPGLMASRNAQADLLLIALAATLSLAAALPSASAAARWGAAGTVAALLVVALVLSASRAGLLLLPVPLAMAALFFGGRPRVGLLLVLAALMGAGAVLASQNGMASRTLNRFESRTDPRQIALWPDALEAARSFWPVGAGVGAFVPAFEGVERLDVVDDSAPHRAHADYLEFAIEAGLPGALMLLFFLPCLIWRIGRQLTGVDAANRPQMVFAASGAAVIMLHSIVDYPLRAMSLAVVAGLAAGLLARRTGTR